MTGEVAADFSASASYAKDDLVMYDGDLFCFTSAHAGAWTGQDVEYVDNNVEQQITRIISGYENAQKSAEYVDTIQLDMIQITGTRYRYILSNAEDPRN